MMTKEYRRKYYQEHKEELRDYYRNYHKKHPEKFKSSAKKWKEKNIEKVREYTRTYMKEHPELRKKCHDNFKNKHNWSKYCCERRKARVERLRSEGVTNAWCVVMKGYEPKYKKVGEPNESNRFIK